MCISAYFSISACLLNEGASVQTHTQESGAAPGAGSHTPGSRGAPDMLFNDISMNLVSNYDNLFEGS